jgi:hypothetical protein
MGQDYTNNHERDKRKIELLRAIYLLEPRIFAFYELNRLVSPSIVLTKDDNLTNTAKNISTYKNGYRL